MGSSLMSLEQEQVEPGPGAGRWVGAKGAVAWASELRGSSPPTRLFLDLLSTHYSRRDQPFSLYSLDVVPVADALLLRCGARWPVLDPGRQQASCGLPVLACASLRHP